ncbi:uncharacterized protein LOC103465695 [Poecilia reticulata]|uniref:uncharacterized protein LOC103465695 n=1 Tax=Poecilia reticulata TaxID=8081 RepID=UPI0007EBEB03|nr:PREDICTED: uncharacterized protein LOC103465695 [Poecilia reticulata]XP_008408984.2 PREDICTED: uncharacterized protein LOC103465695 [Poecilia reticulata]XP_008408985.2 PREDICTED: uncharacterized protein LOC103465695 [Poecilia reticulata]XP_008408986.2 PREDICTED: uncharacterized protein LOC103465695 [Poecilia reticulata]XP_008408987.2 PREDICTED: uncharacterized protein LOC103465695 [Poecilia reticulata]
MCVCVCMLLFLLLCLVLDSKSFGGFFIFFLGNTALPAEQESPHFSVNKLEQGKKVSLFVGAVESLLRVYFSSLPFLCLTAKAKGGNPALISALRTTFPSVSCFILFFYFTLNVQKKNRVHRKAAGRKGEERRELLLLQRAGRTAWGNPGAVQAAVVLKLHQVAVVGCCCACVTRRRTTTTTKRRRRRRRKKENSRLVTEARRLDWNFTAELRTERKRRPGGLEVCTEDRLAERDPTSLPISGLRGDGKPWPNETWTTTSPAFSSTFPRLFLLLALVLQKLLCSSSLQLVRLRPLVIVPTVFQ